MYSIYIAVNSYIISVPAESDVTEASLYISGNFVIAEQLANTYICIGLLLRSTANSRAFFFGFFKNLRLNNLDFLSFSEGLDSLERSGRPVGIISTYFRQNSLRGFRAMTKNPPKFTTINTTTIKV